MDGQWFKDAGNHYFPRSRPVIAKIWSFLGHFSCGFFIECDGAVILFLFKDALHAVNTPLEKRKVAIAWKQSSGCEVGLQFPRGYFNVTECDWVWDFGCTQVPHPHPYRASSGFRRHIRQAVCRRTVLRFLARLPGSSASLGFVDMRLFHIASTGAVYPQQKKVKLQPQYSSMLVPKWVC